MCLNTRFHRKFMFHARNISVKLLDCKTSNIKGLKIAGCIDATLHCLMCKIYKNKNRRNSLILLDLVLMIGAKYCTCSSENHIEMT